MFCANRCAYMCFALCCAAAYAQNGGLRISDPVPTKGRTLVTDKPAIVLRGTLVLTGGDTRVLWKNLRGFSDLATVTVSADGRTAHWRSTSSVALRPGINQITVKALGQPGSSDYLNIYYTAPESAPPRQGITLLHGRQINYEVIGGRAVYQGDMILGEERQVAEGRFAGRLRSGGMGVRPQAATIEPNLQYSSGLWPVVNGLVRVPYTSTGVNGATITTAINASNTQLAGIVQWVAAGAGDVNLVNFAFTSGNISGTCESIVGMQGGGAQPIGGADNCTVNTTLHEMGHALGLYHEQSRPDRDSYLNYEENNVDKPQYGNFDIVQAEAASGLYNYASIMEYSSFLFSRYGTAPVLETMPAGIVLGSDAPAYTSGDVDGIRRLYGFTPTAITVDTNPTGLNVVVDSTPCTAPCVFTNWTIGSTHTLSVPLDSHSQTLQILSQQPYVFGNWNANPLATHLNSPSTSQTITITNSAGNGTLLSPTSAPAITNYLASFITVHPFNPTIESNNGANSTNIGSIQVSPPASTLVINGVSTNYFADRQNIAITATAKTGYTFYVWANVAAPTPFSHFLNFYITSNFDSSAIAFFVNDAVTTVTAGTTDNPGNGYSPGFLIWVVETSQGNAIDFGYTPVNFDVSQDGAGFAAGQTLTLCASSLNGTTCPTTRQVQSPVTTNITYTQYSWNGSASGNTNGLTVTIPSGGGQYNANYTDSFRVIILPSISSFSCPGVQVTTSPSPATNNGTGGALDAFFPYTTSSTSLIASGNSNVSFVGWGGDLSSSVTPYPYALNAQLVGTANFNVAGTTAPLAVSSVVSTSTQSTPTVTTAPPALRSRGLASPPTATPTGILARVEGISPSAPSRCRAPPR